MIEGVHVVPLQRFVDARGSVLLMLKETDPHFVRFGEIYFSTTFPGVVKAWKNHRRMDANYACVHGRIKVVLHDRRDGSPTRDRTMELHISPDHEYALVVIPPGVYGFQVVGEPVSIRELCDRAERPVGTERLDADDPSIPYAWAVS